MENCQRHLLMKLSDICKERKLLKVQKLVLLSILCTAITVARAQYTYRGQVLSVIQEEPIGFGQVRLPSANGSMRSGRNGKILSKIDSLGYFNFTLPDTSNISIVVDCVLAGNTLQRIYYSDSLTLVFINSACNDYNSEKAEWDIKNNDKYLLCHLGYATYHFSAADSLFERKYGVTYRTFADTPIESDCMWLYNKTMATYLDSAFGETWRDEVRWDVPGLSTKNSNNPIYKNITGLKQVDPINWQHIKNGFYRGTGGFYSIAFTPDSSHQFKKKEFTCTGNFPLDSGHWQIKNNSSLILKGNKETLAFNVLTFDKFIFFIPEGQRINFIKDLRTGLKRKRRSISFKDGTHYSADYIAGRILLDKYYGFEAEE